MDWLIDWFDGFDGLDWFDWFDWFDLIDWLIWLIWLIDWVIAWLIDLIDWLMDCLIDWLINGWMDGLIDWFDLIDGLLGWLIDWLMDGWMDGWIDWLIWLIWLIELIWFGLIWFDWLIDLLIGLMDWLIDVQTIKPLMRLPKRMLACNRWVMLLCGCPEFPPQAMLLMFFTWGYGQNCWIWVQRWRHACLWIGGRNPAQTWCGEKWLAERTSAILEKLHTACVVLRLSMTYLQAVLASFQHVLGGSNFCSVHWPGLYTKQKVEARHETLAGDTPLQLPVRIYPGYFVSDKQLN